MTRAPDNDLPPKVRKRYVLDGEKVIFAVNQHWLVIVEPVVTCLAVLVVTVWLDLSAPMSAGMLADIAWWVWFASVARVLWCLYEWRNEWFIATNKRMMRVYGIFDRQVAMMPLGKVTDMRYERSIPGRLLGYGTYIMESAGQVQALSQVHFVPHPDHNYRAVVAEMFGVQDDGEVDEDLPPDDEDLDEAYGSEMAWGGHGDDAEQRVEEAHERGRGRYWDTDDENRAPDDRDDDPRDRHDDSVGQAVHRAAYRGFDDDDVRDDHDDGRGPDTVDDLPAVQVEDRDGRLRDWTDHVEHGYGRIRVGAAYDEDLDDDPHDDSDDDPGPAADRWPDDGFDGPDDPRRRYSLRGL